MYNREHTLCNTTIYLPLAVTDVISLIDGLPNISDITLADANVVAAAREAYNSLNEAYRVLVGNIATLAAAETRIEELMEAEVLAINALITALATYATSTDLQNAIAIIDDRISEWTGITLVGIDEITLEAERERLQAQAAMEAEVSAINALITALAAYATSTDLQDAITSIVERIDAWEGIALVGYDEVELVAQTARIATLQQQETDAAAQATMEEEVAAINELINNLNTFTTSEDLQATIDEINRRIENWEGTPLVGIDVETLDVETERVEKLREQEAFVPITGVSLNLSQLILEIGETQTLIATITPDDATNQNVVWASSNPSIVTVNEDGKLVAIAEGTATITVTTKDGEFEASSEITVDAYIDYSWLPIPKAVLIERDDHLEVRIVGPAANTFNRLEVREFTVRGTNIELDMEVRSTVTEIPLTDGRWIIPFPAGKVEIRITNPAGVVITRKYQ